MTREQPILSSLTLSQEQLAIVEQWTQDDIALCVEAAAGSGKTRILTECVRRLLAKPKSHFKIVCLTFTIKAAEEMKERLKDIKNLSERVFIGTIHTFALEILLARKSELGYTENPQILDKEVDKREIVHTIFMTEPILRQKYLEVSTDKSHFTLAKYQEEMIGKSIAFISKLKRNLVHTSDELSQIKGLNEDHKLLIDLYNQQLRHQNLIDFDDILLLAWRILIESPGIANIYQRVYKYVLIDEAQDLNHAQYELIKAFCGKSINNVLMVGDPKQSIHGYADTDVKYMQKSFVADFNAHIKIIEKNYRSAQKIIEIANLILPERPTQIQAHYPGEVEIHTTFANEEMEAEWIVAKLKTILNRNEPQFDGQLKIEDICILARNRYVFNVLIQKLNEDEYLKNSYFVKRSSSELFNPESDYFKILEKGLKLLANNSATLYMEQMADLLGINYIPNGKTEILDILSSFQPLLTDTSKKEVYQQLFFFWKSIEKNILNFPKALIEIKKYFENWQNEAEKALIFEDIKDWQQAWNQYIRNTSAMSNKTIADFTRFISMGYNTNFRQKGIMLSTVHTAKGLEFHIVFLMGMNEGTFPDYRALNSLKSMNEERNNMYVAVTRAKRCLYMSCPKEKLMPWGSVKKQQKSSFLSQLSVYETN